MILEVLVTTRDTAGQIHLAPMGITLNGVEQLVISPFRPSQTLDNLLATEHAVVNACDDVRLFAGCVTGRYNWTYCPVADGQGYYLADALSYSEVAVVAYEDDPVRPRVHCQILTTRSLKPFCGFNRAQFSVLEAAILVSRLDRLPWQKIVEEIRYLRIGFEKTAGPREREAWAWLMAAIEHYRLQHGLEALSE